MTADTLAGHEVLPPSAPPVAVIMDTGAQYSGLVDRRAVEWGIRTIVVDIETPAEEIAALNPVGIIIPGGPKSTYDEDAPHADPAVFGLGIPTLGICYGMQDMARTLGGEVRHTSTHEGTTLARQDGLVDIELTENASRLFKEVKPTEKGLSTHGDSVIEAPPGFKVTAMSGGIIAAFADEERKLYATQFHPEAADTKSGTVIFDNFFRDICEQEPSYTLEDQLDEAIAEIQAIPANSDFVVALSGGVDSAVSAELLLAAGIDPSRIHLVHVDHGFMRRQESNEIVASFRERGVNVTVINAFEEFANATMDLPDGSISKPLREATQNDAELKRKICGKKFIEIFNRYMQDNDLGDAYLVQGSLRPDVIESGLALASRRADVVVTHHNAVAETEEMREAGRMVEPLKHLHKDQVRAIGRKLGMPESIVGRHPFPGPGLMIRILAHDGRNLDESPVRLLSGNVFDETSRQDLQADVRRWFHGAGFRGVGMHVLGLLSRGVRGDASSDGLVSAFEIDKNGRAPSYEDLVQVGTELTNTHPDIIRFTRLIVRPSVVAGRDFKMIPTELESADITLLQQADAVARDTLTKSGESDNIAQLPVILTPASLNGRDRAVVLRPFVSPDFMTGRAAVPGVDLSVKTFATMVRHVLGVPGVESVLYDLTHKPPGRTEWE